MATIKRLKQAYSAAALPGYQGTHFWIRRHHGRPNRCEHCGSTGEPGRGRYDWANISGEYRRDPTDWLQLCRSCHCKFDLSKRQTCHRGTHPRTPENIYTSPATGRHTCLQCLRDGQSVRSQRYKARLREKKLNGVN